MTTKKQDTFLMALTDSSLSSQTKFGTELRRVKDGKNTFDACLCVAYGCSLMLPYDGRVRRPMSAISIALDALESSNPVIRKRVAGDPPVRVIVLNAKGCISTCRSRGEEFPGLVAARRRSPLVSRFETPWTVCDLEDVILQRQRRQKFAALEACTMRESRELFGEIDTYHLRPEIAKDAENEILKAVRRTAVARFGDSLNDGGIVMLISAGWNVDKSAFVSLDRCGKAWLRAETVATAELCALDGHPVSAFREKLRELVQRRYGNHRSFIKQAIPSIVPLPAPRKKCLRSKCIRNRCLRKKYLRRCWNDLDLIEAKRLRCQ